MNKIIKYGKKSKAARQKRKQRLNIPSKYCDMKNKVYNIHFKSGGIIAIKKIRTKYLFLDIIMKSATIPPRIGIALYIKDFKTFVKEGIRLSFLGCTKLSFIFITAICIYSQSKYACLALIFFKILMTDPTMLAT